MSLSSEPELKSDAMCPWSEELSDELLYEVAAQFSDEEQEAEMDTSEPTATLLEPLNIYIQEMLLDCYRNTYKIKLLENEFRALHNILFSD